MPTAAPVENARACIREEQLELAALTRQRDVALCLLAALPHELLNEGFLEALELELHRVLRPAA